MELLKTLQRIETDFGRIRVERWGTRTLDIDILLYENRIIELPKLTIPHVEMLHRQFVLAPAADVAADWVHPLTLKTIGEHWQEMGTCKCCIVLSNSQIIPKTESVPDNDVLLLHSR